MSAQICFRVPKRVKELLELDAKRRGLDLSKVFQSYAFQLVLNIDPMILRDRDVQEWLDRVFSHEEDSVHLSND